MQVELSKKIKDYEAEIAKEQGEMDDVEKVKEEIDGWEKEQSRVRLKQTQMDEKIAKWHANSKSKTELEMMRNDKRTKQDQIRRNKQHVEEDLDKFFEMSDNSQVLENIPKCVGRLFDLFNYSLTFGLR